MRKIYYQLFIFTLAVLTCAVDGYGQNILFVGRDALGDYQSDQDLVDSLTSWGYVCDFWDSNGEYTTGVGLDYNSYDGMFIAESVDSKAMARFGTSDGYPLPCVNLEGYCVATGSDRWEWINVNADELFQTADGGGTADDQVFVVKDNTHYITSGFQVGDEITWSSDDVASDILLIRPVSIKQVNVTYSNKLGQMKSHLSNADFWNMVTVDDMDDTGNRMVYWGLNHIGLNGELQEGSYGTPEFFMLVKRALEWSLGEDGGETSVKQFRSKTFELVAFPNPASEQVTVRFRASAGGDALANLYNMAGQTVDMFSKSTVEGNNFFFLDADAYPAGIYQLHLWIDGKSAATKVVIR